MVHGETHGNRLQQRLIDSLANGECAAKSDVSNTRLLTCLAGTHWGKCRMEHMLVFILISIHSTIIGIQLQMWMWVIVISCIGKMIAGDLGFMASWLGRLAVSWPGMTCCHFIILISRCRPAGLHRLYKRKRKGRKYYTFRMGKYFYEIISSATDWY